MKFYAELLTCGNCHYTRNNSEWYTSKETKVLYCTKDCYLAKEHGINSYWNEDGSLNQKKFEENITVVRKNKPTKIGLPENRKRLHSAGVEKARSSSFDDGYDAGFKAGIEYAKGIINEKI
jgi:hypothetical protein